MTSRIERQVLIGRLTALAEEMTGECDDLEDAERHENYRERQERRARCMEIRDRVALLEEAVAEFTASLRELVPV